MEENDDELDELDETEVPAEIQEWLSKTFTRQSFLEGGTAKPYRISFRGSVVAIMATQRIERKSFVFMTPQVEEFLVNFDLWGFDIFNFDTLSQKNALKYTAHEVFHRYNILSTFKILPSVFEGFLEKLQEGYNHYGNPYHNAIHAADVTHTLYQLIHRSRLDLWMTTCEIFAALFSAIIHDFEHTGQNNIFHVNSKSALAVMYNDRSVLENHHLSCAFQVLHQPAFDITAKMDRDDFAHFRSIVIDAVLATDPAFHFDLINSAKQNITGKINCSKTKAINMLLHAADISSPTKPWNLYIHWTRRIFTEFFAQGDKEREMGLPISPLCDRHTTKLPMTQIGFMDFIVWPSFNVAGDLIDLILEEMHQKNIGHDAEGGVPDIMDRVWEKNLESNLQQWVKIKDRSINLEDIASDDFIADISSHHSLASVNSYQKMKQNRKFSMRPPPVENKAAGKDASDSKVVESTHASQVPTLPEPGSSHAPEKRMSFAVFNNPRRGSLVSKHRYSIALDEDSLQKQSPESRENGGEFKDIPISKRSSRVSQGQLDFSTFRNPRSNTSNDNSAHPGSSNGHSNTSQNNTITRRQPVVPSATVPKSRQQLPMGLLPKSWQQTSDRPFSQPSPSREQPSSNDTRPVGKMTSQEQPTDQTQPAGKMPSGEEASSKARPGRKMSIVSQFSTVSQRSSNKRVSIDATPPQTYVFPRDVSSGTSTNEHDSSFSSIPPAVPSSPSVSQPSESSTTSSIIKKMSHLFSRNKRQ